MGENVKAELLEALRNHGTLRMAEIFLHSPRTNLDEAAIAWAHYHGYTVVHYTVR